MNVIKEECYSVKKILLKCDWSYEKRCANHLPGKWKRGKNGGAISCPALRALCMYIQGGFISTWPCEITLLFVAYASHLPRVSHADRLAINHFFQTALGLSSPLCRLDLLLSWFHINLADGESLVENMGSPKYLICPLCHFLLHKLSSLAPFYVHDWCTYRKV